MSRIPTLAGLSVVAAAALAGATLAGAADPPRVYELRGGQWWNGAAFERVTRYSVDGVFATRRPPQVDSVIDLAGRFIVPPYAEAHTHTIAYVRSRIDEFLAQGVFYAMVMNVHRSFIGQNFTWFGRRGSVDVNFAAAGVTASDGHPIQIGLRGDATPEELDGDWVTIMETPEDLEEKWPALRDANPSLVKIFLLYSDRYAERHGDTLLPTRFKGMDPALVEPLVERAHDAGIRVAAHVRTAHDFRVAVEAGVDIVAHLPGFSMGYGSLAGLRDSDRQADVDHPEWFRIRPADAALAARRGVTVITTIGSLGSVPDSLPEGVRSRFERLFTLRRAVITDNLRLLRDHGVRIAVGSDAGEGSPVNEALVLRDLGVFDNAGILSMLTEEATRVTFPRRSVGRLDDGYEASFLALSGDPTTNLDHIRDIAFRFKQGRPLVLPPPVGRGASRAGGQPDPAPETAGACASRDDSFRNILEEFQSRQRNVGLGAAVLHDGRVVYEEGFGFADREAERPVTADTRFGIASLTKAFTGLTLLAVAARGDIDLDAEIQRYVEEFPPHPSGRAVTLRHVAAQLAGIRHWGEERNDELYSRRIDNVEEILPLFIHDPWVEERDLRYSYSSYGYNLLAIALQRATGRPFQELVREAVIEPLGLRSVDFDAPGFAGDLRAARYSYYDLQDYHELEHAVRVPDLDYSHNMAGGNMVADVTDLVRLGEAARQPDLLDEVSHEALWTRPVLDGVSSPMSFGWFVREGGNRIAISGSNPGLQGGLAVWRDQGTVVAVVANSWGIGSRSAELVDDSPDGLLGRLAAVCSEAGPRG